MTTVTGQPTATRALHQSPDWEIIADDGATPEQRQAAWQRAEPALPAGREAGRARAIADAATGYTQSVMAGKAMNAEKYRITAAEMERSAHSRLSPAETARLDAEMAAAENRPEVGPGQAAAARAQARTSLQAWLDGPEAG